MSVDSLRPLAPTRPAGPVVPVPAAPAPPAPPAPVPVAAPETGAPGVVAEVVAELDTSAADRAAARLRDWRAFDLVDGRRRQARADLALARRALDDRSAHHAPVRAAARALVAALASGLPLDPASARPETAPEQNGFWLRDGIETLRRLASGDAEPADTSDAPVDAEDAARTPLFVALGALRARLGTGADGLDDEPAHARRAAAAPGEAVEETPDAPAAGTGPGATRGPAADPTLAARRLARAAGDRALAALAAQRPDALDPAALPLLEAHARGLFDPAAADAIERLVDGWTTRLGDTPSRTDRELRRWSTALTGLCPRLPDELFPALRAATGESWPAVATALRAAALPGAVEEWCAALDAGRHPGRAADPAEVESTARAAVDDALATLIDAPDAEEAALAARVRDARARLRAPVDDVPLAADAPAGDAAPAASGTAADDRVFPEDPAAGLAELSPAPFGQWLATIAMAPDRVGASPSFRRWAALRARSAILGAFDLLAEEARANPARDVAVALEGWRGRLADPDGALVQSLDVAMRRRGAASELATHAPRGGGLLLAAGLLLVAFGALARVWALALAGCAAVAAWRVTRGAHEQRRARVRAAAGMAHARAVAALRAVVDEWAAVRRDLAEGVARMPAARDRLRRALAR